jgi:hypothetical protein
MKTTLSLTFVAILAAWSAGCASDSKRFDHVEPGMTSAQVKDAMDSGPSKFGPVADTGYTAWYWGDDYCVLFKDDKVVSKDTTSEGTSGNVQGVEYKEQHKAACLAPGQTAQGSKDRSFGIPGVGTIHLPSGG